MIPALIKKALAAYLLAVAAFAAAASLSCLLLSNKSIFTSLFKVFYFSRLYKITLFFRKMQGIIGKCLRVKEITEKAKKKGFFVVTIKIFIYFCKNKKPGVITSIE